MTLDDGSPLLAAYPVKKGKVILSAVALDDAYGNAHRHTLFFVPLHNIGILTSIQNKLYNVIGVDNMQTVALRSDNSDEVFTLKARNSKEEFIPEQRKIGNETAFYFHDHVNESGLYDIVKGGAVFGTIAFNANRNESDLNCYEESELKEMAKSSKDNIEVISGDTKNIAKSVTDRLNGKSLWQYFLIFSLLCFLTEIILLRFWGRPTLTNDKLS